MRKILFIVSIILSLFTIINGSKLDSPTNNAEEDIVSNEEKETETIHLVPKSKVDTSEINDTEVKDTEIKDTEVKDTEVKDSEVKDIEVKDTEVKDNEVKDTEEDETNDIPIKPSLIKWHKDTKEEKSEEMQEPTPCTCGVFLSGQFKKGSKKQPKGSPLLTQEMDTPFMNNAVGHRQCTNKCLELIIKHLPKGNEIICATVDREHVFKERAYLFVKNHSDKWHGTNLSAGREYCCRDYVPYKCPIS